MNVEFFPINYLKMQSKRQGSPDYAFSVIIARNQKGEFIFCRHKERITWEFPGGHIEKGETALEAAKRELVEETGAAEFTLRPIFDYSVEKSGKWNCGVVFLADITTFDEIPNSEIAEIVFLKRMPRDMTYSEIQPKMMTHYNELFGKKPPYLYHASREKLGVVLPCHAEGYEDENGREYGVYAYETSKQTIPFALSFSGDPDMYVDDLTSEVYIENDVTLLDDEIGYIHKLSSSSFERLDELQWLSKRAVAPLEVIKIRSGDYKNIVHFGNDKKIEDKIKQEN